MKCTSPSAFEHIFVVVQAISRFPNILVSTKRVSLRRVYEDDLIESEDNKGEGQTVGRLNIPKMTMYSESPSTVKAYNVRGAFFEFAVTGSILLYLAVLFIFIMVRGVSTGSEWLLTHGVGLQGKDAKNVPLEIMRDIKVAYRKRTNKSKKN